MISKKVQLFRYIPYVFFLMAAGVITWWLVHNPVQSFSLAVPGMDNRTISPSHTNETIKIGEFFTYFGDVAPVPGTRWPRFRGADLDNINKEKIPLIDSWGASGPRILWTLELGEGHAAPAVYDGKIYLLDYNEALKQDALRCLSLETGEELWQRSYSVHLKRNHGLSRTVPTVNEHVVVTMGPRCQVMCVERSSGDFLWGIDLEKEYSVEVPFWYTGQCPLIVDDTAIIAVGGSSLMIGVDCHSGKVAWATPNPHGWKMSHASVMPMTYNGKKMYIYPAIGGVCAISAEGADRGEILWENPEFSPSVVAPSPVILEKGKIFLTAGYGYGGAVLQVREHLDHFSAEIVQKYKPSEGLASEQQTPIYYHGFLLAIMPKDAGGLRNEFVAFRPDDCRKVVMRSGKTTRFGMGPYIIADGKIFILNDDGEMTIARFSGNQFTILDQRRIIEGQDSWGPIAITGGYLLMRDSKHLVCLDVRKK
ncbi:MAG: PQQ-binding-like beta-propeller repeat protein [Bacteroidales bacterium]|nr:PQQ-binding-like beta-propeller repeat protein [Bacteroidales bacterium]